MPFVSLLGAAAETPGLPASPPAVTIPYVSLLYTAALLAYFILAAFVISRNPRSTLNWSCALFTLALAIWSFEDVFHGMPGLPGDRVNFYSDIGTVGRFLAPSLFLCFAIIFARRRHTPTRQLYSTSRRSGVLILRHGLLRLALFGVPVFLMTMFWTRHFVWDNELHSFGWVVAWRDNLWSRLFYAYLLLDMGLGFWLILRFRNRTRDARERRQAGIIVAATATSLVLGMITDVISPMRHVDVPELAGFLSLIWAGGLVYSIARLRMLITPRAAADEILRTMRDAVILLSPERIIMAANQAAVDLSGYPREDLIGHPALKLFLEAAHFNEITRQLERENGDTQHSPLTTPQCLEIPFTPRDGGEIPVSISARTMRGKDGSLIGSVWVLRDVTLQKQAEAILRRSHAELEELVRQRTGELESVNSELAAKNAKLAASEQRYRLLAENSSDVIWTADLEMRTTYISPSVEAASGFKPEEMIGEPPEKFMTPASLAKARQAMGDALLVLMKGGRLAQTERIVFEYYRKNRTTYWAEVSVSLLFDPRGNPTGFLGVSRDITERRKVEEELARYREELEKLLAQRA
jgi:PAS domain S-box-containing protein